MSEGIAAAASKTTVPRSAAFLGGVGLFGRSLESLAKVDSGRGFRIRGAYGKFGVFAVLFSAAVAYAWFLIPVSDTMESRNRIVLIAVAFVLSNFPFIYVAQWACKWLWGRVFFVLDSMFSVSSWGLIVGCVARDGFQRGAGAYVLLAFVCAAVVAVCGVVWGLLGSKGGSKWVQFALVVVPAVFASALVGWTAGARPWFSLLESIAICVVAGGCFFEDAYTVRWVGRQNRFDRMGEWFAGFWMMIEIGLIAGALLGGAGGDRGNN